MTAYRTIFMGTPDFAAVILRHLAGSDICELAGAYTQPDRPCGRGRECKPSPVKSLALELGLPVFQPENFKDQADIDQLAALKPDLLVVAAYGLILPQSVLDIPSIMPVNVHASLLPFHRGAAPIQRAIQNGDVVTGTTIMRMEAGLDTGPILLQRSLRIGHDQHAGEIHDELADQGGRMMVEAMLRLRDNRLIEIQQDDDKATYAAKLSKEEGLVNFDRPAQQVHDHIRAMHPWPGAYTFIEHKGKKLRLVITPGSVGPDLTQPAAPGTILGEVEGRLGIACADKVFLTTSVKPEGSKTMDAAAFCCGYMNVC